MVLLSHETNMEPTVLSYPSSYIYLEENYHREVNVHQALFDPQSHQNKILKMIS